MRSLLLILPILLFVCSCSVDPEMELSENDSYVVLDLPAGFSQPYIPEDNKLSKYRIRLGKRLFFDKRFSKNGDISCASCHLQEFAFAANSSLSLGTGGKSGFRNAPALFNLAYHPFFFRDGGARTLELQVLVPLDSDSEMDMDMEKVVQILKNDDEYVALFALAYQNEPDPFGFTRAIAAFERTLISGNSPYDKYIHGDDKNSLTEEQLRGMKLFFSDKTNCSRCHSGFNFTNNSFENNGLYVEYADSGRSRVTLRLADFGKFKVPSLRNVEVTKPYMHDGSLQSIEEVIRHYNSGGKGHFNQSEFIKPLKLTDQEKKDLKAFLLSLTDVEFLNNPEFTSGN